MISLPHLLEQACLPEGLIILQTVEDFLHGLELDCYLCHEIRTVSERYQDSRFTNSFYHFEKDKPLFKNVICRKLDQKGMPDIIPKDLHFDTMSITLGSTDALESLYFDVQALDGKLERHRVSGTISFITNR